MNCQYVENMIIMANNLQNVTLKLSSGIRGMKTIFVRSVLAGKNFRLFGGHDSPPRKIFETDRSCRC